MTESKRLVKVILKLVEARLPGFDRLVADTEPGTMRALERFIEEALDDTVASPPRKP